MLILNFYPVMLLTYFHLALRLGMSGGTPPLTLYTFMELTEAYLYTLVLNSEIILLAQRQIL
jgi:hypothetical protein